jgi:ligand-binding sensor domain-containing protein
MRCNKISENQILAFCANEVAIVDILKKKVIKKWHLENIAEVIYVGDPQNNQNLIGTRNGLYVFENSTISAHNLNSKLSAFAICDILKDDFGNIWVATLRNGLIKFGKYPIKKDPRFESIVEPISSFHFDSNGALLIGTQGTNFYRFKESLQSIPFKEMTSVVHSIIELNTDEFLIFAENRVDYVKGSEKHTLLCAIKAVQITEDKQTLYLGHALGTTKINTKVFLATIKNKDESILPTFLENNLNCPKYVNSLVLENQNRLIIGSKIGLSIWENGITKQYTNPELSSKLYVFKIQMLKPNIYALGTLGNGLVIVNTKTDKITNINTANYLADNFVTNLFVAPTGKIWIRHNLGLSSANLLDDKPEIKNYGSSDGLDNSVVYAMTSFEGKMLIRTGSGIYSFTELEMEQFRSLPSIFRFETLRINQKSTQIEDDLVYISSGEDFSINFDFINYNLGDKITYSYRLKDFSNTWLQTESEQISYSGLKSGTYDLEVFAKNDVGNRSSTSILKIVVNNPWYRTTLARFTFLLLFVGFTFGLF